MKELRGSALKMLSLCVLGLDLEKLKRITDRKTEKREGLLKKDV